MRGNASDIGIPEECFGNPDDCCNRSTHLTYLALNYCQNNVVLVGSWFTTYEWMNLANTTYLHLQARLVRGMCTFHNNTVLITVTDMNGGNLYALPSYYCCALSQWWWQLMQFPLIHAESSIYGRQHWQSCSISVCQILQVTEGSFAS